MVEPSFARLGATPPLKRGEMPRRYDDLPVSRASGLIPAPRRIEDYARWSQSAPRKAPKEKSGGQDIFIGGGGDDLGWVPILGQGLGVMKDYADGYRRETGRPTRYFPNNKRDEVLRAVRDAQDSGGPVNIVGHSWGGTDAYNVAAAARRQGLRVDNVATLDPVGGRYGLGAVKERQVPRDWLNVTATPPTTNSSDWIATIGGKPSRLPLTHAGRNVTTSNHHWDVGSMMAAGPREVLDRSRRLALESELHDDLPPKEWNRRRNAQAARRR